MCLLLLSLGSLCRRVMYMCDTCSCSAAHHLLVAREQERLLQGSRCCPATASSVPTYTARGRVCSVRQTLCMGSTQERVPCHTHALLLATCSRKHTACKFVWQHMLLRAWYGARAGLHQREGAGDCKPITMRDTASPQLHANSNACSFNLSAASTYVDGLARKGCAAFFARHLCHYRWCPV
jgi:hypothetical protein